MVTTTRKMTENPVIRCIVRLVREKGKREKDLTDYLRLSPRAMSRWKYDGSNVYIKYIKEICELRLSPAEKEIIRVYRSLDDGRKKCIQETLKYFNESSKKKKTSD